jgi:hypothetical protein
MGTRNRSSYIAQLSCIAVAWVFMGCASLGGSPPSGAEAVNLVCQPSAETEVHAPGDSHWIGHDVRQLQQVLGKEEMCLGRPSKYLVLVYSRAGKNCIDAYVIDNCNTVINYYCRPAPRSPMNWGRQSPIPAPQ